ncbi:hypothetical protein [Catellatospora tritici]|uniref:hypothetical protein n=1 Tax=Catellatospora tritici TaxID=2851566 RepID=UPI001C2DBB81|nr:hypothetical protein [Catellatospora tritici]MBV1856689.1 hypothetical protein [Catellatospora tritici]
MAHRPSDYWRQCVADDNARVASGERDRAYAAELFPEALLTDTHIALSAFEADLRWLDPTSADDVFTIIERIVLDLNRVNAAHGGAAYETDERERLCGYIEATLHEAGVDLDAVAQTRRLTRHEITNEWRNW